MKCQETKSDSVLSILSYAYHIFSWVIGKESPSGVISKGNCDDEFVVL